jgi:hypothetical protein
MSETEPELEVAPAPVDDLAKGCVRFVKEALSLDVDFTPETLPIVDHYARNTAGAAEARDEVRDLLTPALGAYFGEVVRRTIPGVRWHVPADVEDYANYRLEFELIFLHFNPLGVAREVLEQDEVPDSGGTFEVLDEARIALHEALEQNGGVSLDDYYSFTIRYETLELVISVLSALEHSTQTTPRRFGPEVYRAASGETLGQGGSS